MQGYADLSLPHEDWTHAAHLAIACVTCRRMDPEPALTALREGIQRLNRAQGTPETRARGYHETVTRLHFARTVHFLRGRAGVPLPGLVREWVEAAADRSWVRRHYSEEVLTSAAARYGWVEPDRAPLEPGWAAPARTGLRPMTPKQAVAERAIAEVRPGMRLGLGSGTTVDEAIRALARRVAAGLEVTLVVASERSDALARELGLGPVPLDDVDALDLAFDGADECDPHLNLIKGGGGALVREKLLALAALEFVVIAEERKAVPVLGDFPLPVALLPFGARHTLRRLQDHCPGLRVRHGSDGRPAMTDDSLLLAELPMGRIPNPAELERRLQIEPGVVEVGLFCGLAKRALLAGPSGEVREVFPAPGF